MRADRFAAVLASVIAHLGAVVVAARTWDGPGATVSDVPRVARRAPATAPSRLVFLVADREGTTPPVQRFLPRARVAVPEPPAPSEPADPSVAADDTAPEPDSAVVPVDEPSWASAATRGLVPSFSTRSLWLAVPTPGLPAPMPPRPRCGERDFACLAYEFRWLRDSLARHLLGCRDSTTRQARLRPQECVRPGRPR